jgi:hypothetical protein
MTNEQCWSPRTPTYAIRFAFSHCPGVEKFTKRFLYSEVIFFPTGAGVLRGYDLAVVATAGGALLEAV